ncbi:DUF3888 domain-containing protein [Gottfriedia sp. NPDC057948]|uniref:DUF3888 domain-containing protein n=1 Tax=Gottfriedia sp. NPDC057948 TaxID=3346287 RepID=UPI0036DF1F77
MKKIAVFITVVMVLVISNTKANAETINEAETKLSETLKLSLINSLREPVDKAIIKIYKDDKKAPKHLTWASYETELLKIKQLNGIGGLYEITLKVYPYYRAHISYGEDEVVINSNGELITFKHLKTYP